MITKLLFDVFSGLLLLFATMVIVSRNTARAALYLVLCFVCTAPLWVMAGAEFLSLILIVVYVGAVMTLFIFVIMMLNLRHSEKFNFVRYFPAVMIAMMLFGGVLISLLRAGLTRHHVATDIPIVTDNTALLGQMMYTHDNFALEVVGMILLTAIVAAIALAFRGPRQRLTQDIQRQINIRREDRVRLINMPVEKDL